MTTSGLKSTRTIIVLWPAAMAFASSGKIVDGKSLPSAAFVFEHLAC